MADKVVSFKADDIKTLGESDREWRFVKIPEWYQGESDEERDNYGLWLVSLTPNEVQKFSDVPEDKQIEGIARGIIMCAVVAEGSLVRVFNMTHLPFFQNRQMKVMSRIQDVMLDMNGLNKGKTAAQRGNS